MPIGAEENLLKNFINDELLNRIAKQKAIEQSRIQNYPLHSQY